MTSNHSAVSRRIRTVAYVTVFALVSITVVAIPARAQTDSFTPTGAMTTARSQHTATLLPNGQVLITGGVQSTSLSAAQVLATTELYNPLSGRFTAAATMTTTRRMHTSTLLPDGRVLIVGGYGGDKSSWGSALAGAELYDPSSDRLVATGNLTTARGGHTALLLRSGTVLILGGYGVGTYPNVAPAELYDPDSGTFTAAGTYVGRGGCDFCAPSTLLADNTALFPAQRPAQIYDPRANAFTPIGMMIEDHSAATLLLNGQVLFAGGESDFGRSATAELYDAAIGAFSTTGSMASRRVWHTLTLLPTGLVLAAGGETDRCTGMSCVFAGSIRNAELYDPASATFHATADMTTAREGHTATLLQDGRVLIAGGASYGGIGVFFGSLSNAELYRPDVLVPAPTLLALPRGSHGQGVIFHAGTSYVAAPEDPAGADDEVDVVCVGIKPTDALPPEVSVGGRFAEIVSFRDAPGIAGASALRVRVPRGLRAGTVLVRLTYLGRSSNAVTMAVK